MTPIEHIRRFVFEVTQAQFAAIAGTTQASVSRWENGEQAPDQKEMARIRTAARRRRLPWEDRWFFEVPPSAPRSVEPERAAS